MRGSLVVALVLVGAGARADSFQLHAPDGWVELYPHLARPEARASAEAIAQLPGLVLAAADLDGAAGGRPAMLTAAVRRPTLPPLGPAQLASLAADLPGAFARGTGGTMVVRDSSLVTVNGVTCARVVADLTRGGDALEQVQYFLPGRSERAVMTFLMPRGQLARYDAAIARAVAASTGFSAPAQPWYAWARWALLAAAILVAVVWWRRRPVSA